MQTRASTGRVIAEVKRSDTSVVHAFDARRSRFSTQLETAEMRSRSIQLANPSLTFVQTENPYDCRLFGHSGAYRAPLTASAT